MENKQKINTNTKNITYSIGISVLFMAISFILLVLDSKSAAADMVVSIKPQTYLSDNVVTVGDVFTNAGEHTNHVLAPAPAAGEVMELGLYDLQRIAQAFNLKWVPSNRHESVVLQRAIHEVEKSEIALLIEEALKNETGAEHIEIDTETVLPRLMINGTEKPVLSADKVDFNPVTERFEVTVHISGENGQSETTKIKGRIHRLIEVPVLTENLRKGDIIRKHHIQYTMMRHDSLMQNYALNTEDVVGMTPRRSLIAERPIRISDVEKPRLINKGDMITMTLQNGPMSLSAKGRAMDAGAIDDVIRVMNTSSNRIIEARVNGPHQAHVTSH